MPSFHVDGRVSIKLDYDLAVRLGEFLINSKTKDKQLIALGHRLFSLDQSEENSNTENNDWSGYMKDNYENTSNRQKSFDNVLEDNFKKVGNYLESEIVQISTPIRLKKRIIKN